MDVSNLSLAELKELFGDLPKIIANREKDEKAAARKELEVRAAELGFSLDELIGGKQDAETKKMRTPVAAKYRDPVSGATWTGRGRSPAWLVGKNKEDYKI